jgi:hypothetical protein
MANTNPREQFEYYVSKGGDNLGPWAIDEIVAQMSRTELAPTDFVYIEAREEWIPLMECEAVRNHLQLSRPKAPPPTNRDTASSIEPKQQQTAEKRNDQASDKVVGPDPEQWFVQKGVNRYGPFTHLGIIQALQEKTVYDFDFVSQKGSDSWVRIAEHEAFQPERIRELASQIGGREKAEGYIFTSRQHPRIPFTSDVLVHDEHSVWVGKTFEASVGGSGLVIENSTLTPGQVLRMHFSSCDDVPAFNALGEIVGKRYSSDVRGAKSPVKYSVRFLQIDSQISKAVEEMARRHTATASGR